MIALRFREPDRERPYRMPLSISVSGGSIPVPAVVGAVASALGWVALLIFHTGARYVGLAWLLSGLLLYVGYRKSQQKPLLKRVTIPERALRYEALEPEFGSILVPILGTALDDDIIQTAGRLAGETRDDLESEGAMIEAIWVFEIPLALPMDAPLPDAQVKRAREALARAKLVGEEYEGVEVATAIVRARRAGEAIVREARRRGVEAIVLAAEESSRVRGGSLFGGVGGPLENYVGDVSRYVIAKAPCRVILTAPPADWRANKPPPPDPRRSRPTRSSSPRRPTVSRPGPVRDAPMAERKLEGLQRVLGVYPLASSAYGNVGSSIYYALGLVAALALGLTPIVFIISGFIFFLTASTYAEATAMFPEAGGSSSFARHAFNEFWSFFAAWGQMLNYMLTIATSAFFVPHYIGGLFWPALEHPPGDVIAGIVAIFVLAAINIRGVEESIGVNLVLAVIDFCTQVLIVCVGLVLVFSPQTLINNVHLGTAPTWANFFVAIPLCMLAYTGIETISNMSEEAKDPGRTVPKAINRVVIAVFAIYALLPAIALSALPVRCVGNHCQTLLGVDDQHGGYAGDPVLGVVRALHLGRSSTRPRSTSGCSRRRSCSSRPTPASSACRG